MCGYLAVADVPGLHTVPLRRCGGAAGVRDPGAFEAALFLRIDGWRLHRPPARIHADMIAMSDGGTFDFGHLDPWLREFARPEGARP